MNILGFISKEKGTVVSESTIIKGIQYKYDDRIKQIITTDLQTGKKDYQKVTPTFTFKEFRTYIKAIMDSYRPEYSI